MKLPRPYIPLSVRLAVARSQLYNFKKNRWKLSPGAIISKTELDRVLFSLFGNAKFHLDHDPPLCLREYNPKTKQYVPDANDPNHLRYINAESHRVKTFIKGEGARRSDMGQRRYLKRVIARRNPKPRFKPRAAKHIRRIPHAPVTRKNGD